MTDTEAQEAALRESLAPLRAIAAQSQRMPDTEAAPHVHEWASRVQSDAEPAFAWDCAGPGCGETVTMGWRPEFSGLGFEDVGTNSRPSHWSSLSFVETTIPPSAGRM